MAREVPIKVKVEPDLSGLADLQSAMWDLGQALCKAARVLSPFTGVDIPDDDVSMDTAPDRPVQDCTDVHGRVRHGAHDWTRRFPGQPDRHFRCPGLDPDQCHSDKDHGPHDWTPKPPGIGVSRRCPGRSTA